MHFGIIVLRCISKYSRLRVIKRRKKIVIKKLTCVHAKPSSSLPRLNVYCRCATCSQNTCHQDSRSNSNMCVVGVMKMRMIVPRVGFEPTSAILGQCATIAPHRLPQCHHYPHPAACLCSSLPIKHITHTHIYIRKQDTGPQVYIYRHACYIYIACIALTTSLTVNTRGRRVNKSPRHRWRHCVGIWN